MAAQQLLDPAAAPEGTTLSEYGWTLTDATHRIDHLASHSKAELLEAVAYLACQYHGALKSKTDRDARLALMIIKNALTEYEGKAS
jgi:hypothetical protein